MQRFTATSCTPLVVSQDRLGHGIDKKGYETVRLSQCHSNNRVCNRLSPFYAQSRWLADHLVPTYLPYLVQSPHSQSQQQSSSSRASSDAFFSLHFATHQQPQSSSREDVYLPLSISYYIGTTVHPRGATTVPHPMHPSREQHHHSSLFRGGLCCAT